MKLLRSLLVGAGLLWLGLITPVYAVVQSTLVGNAAYTITNTDTFITTTTAFSASRTWTLPSAAGTCIGQTCTPPNNELVIYDRAGALTATNTLVIAPATGETINGNAANLILSTAKVRVFLTPTSSSDWSAYVVGDFRTSSVLVGDAVALTTATAANVTTISLSQGIWDCTGQIARTLAAATSVTVLKSSVSATTATSGTLGLTMAQLSTAANVMALPATQQIGPVRLTLAATTTYYLVAQDTFTVDTNAAYGSLYCNRVK